MSTLTTLDWVSKLKDELIQRENAEAARGRVRLTIGTASCGIAAGALDVVRALEDEIKAQHLKDIAVIQTGCAGLCRHEPILEVHIGNGPRVSYGNVNPEKVKRIVREHILGGSPVEEFVIDATPFPTI